MLQMSVAKNWCFTINNPTGVERVLFADGLPSDVLYLVYQLERGAGDTEHVQGFIQFSVRKRMNGIKNISYQNTEGATVKPFERAHLEVMRGTPKEASDYCKKEASRIAGPFEFGELKGGQGTRTDLAVAAKSILDTGSLKTVAPDVILKYASGCFKLLALAKAPRRDDLQVFCIRGATGIGKSYAIHGLFPDVYSPFYGNGGLWWDGYTDQKVVMLEEYRGQVQLQKLLQILDPYPLRLEVKGGAVPARYTLCFITSNAPPQDWYENKDGKRNLELNALYRRLGIDTGRYIDVGAEGIQGRHELHAKLRTALLMHGHSLPLSLADAPGSSLIPSTSSAVPPRSTTPILTSSASTSSPPSGSSVQVMPPLKRTHAEAVLVSSDSSDEDSDDPDADAQHHDILV